MIAHRARLARMRLAGIIVSLLILAGCSSRLTRGNAREQIQELGGADLLPANVEVKKVSAMSDKEAIAEVNIQLAFQFERDGGSRKWKVAAVRIGDRNWIPVQTIIEAVDAKRAGETVASLDLLAEGTRRYRETNNEASLTFRDIVALNDVLHPRYIGRLIREDSWGRPILVEAGDAGRLRLRSVGPDGLRGSPDDIVVQSR